VATAEGIFGSAGLIATTLLVFVQVLNRYWLHFEIMWFGDLALYCFIFFMLVAGAFTTWREGHIAVDFFRGKAFGSKPRAYSTHRASIVVISIAIAGVFLPTAYEFMLRAIKYPEYGTLVRWFNTSWLQITLFVALALVLVHLLVIAGRDIGDVIRNYRTGSRR
jgi:TRAP-type C4-dicarboxylate transport system permease small subunit